MDEIKINIIPFEDKYESHFAQLNFEWLEKYFYIEDYDKEVLTNPKKYIIDKGGHILFALIDNKPVGCVALIMREENTFELSKMAVTENHQGLKIGQKLMLDCLETAVQHGCVRVFLDSNRILKPALNLYRKFGFNEIPVPKDTPYDRCDIRMELIL